MTLLFNNLIQIAENLTPISFNIEHFLWILSLKKTNLLKALTKGLISLLTIQVSSIKMNPQRSDKSYLLINRNVAINKINDK